MTEKLLTNCTISFERPDAPHLGSARFAFAAVSVALDSIADVFKREMLSRCPMCSGPGGSLPVALFAYFRSSANTLRLALAHPSCFAALPDVSPDVRRDMNEKAARFRAQFEERHRARFTCELSLGMWLAKHRH